MTIPEKNTMSVPVGQAVLYRGGTVYSDADRFATAMLIEQGTVSWIGDEQGADVHQRAGASVVDLASRLLTPAFGDAMGADGVPRSTWARNGVAVVLVDSGHVANPAGGQDLDLGASDVPAYIARNERARVVLHLDEASLGEVACIDPTTLDPQVDLASLASQGMPFAFGTAASRPVSPWLRVQHALARALSARAAFLASTRGVWRASTAPDAHVRGRIMVGSPATFAVWDDSELVTQVADEHRSAWSSDARAGLPPLPALGALDDTTWQPPACLRTVIDGHVVFDALS